VPVTVFSRSTGDIKFGKDIATVDVSKIVPKKTATSNPFLFTVEKL
jgi:hypothetical protein